MSLPFFCCLKHSVGLTGAETFGAAQPIIGSARLLLTAAHVFAFTSLARAFSGAKLSWQVAGRASWMMSLSFGIPFLNQVATVSYSLGVKRGNCGRTGMSISFRN